MTAGQLELASPESYLSELINQRLSDSEQHRLTILHRNADSLTLNIVDRMPRHLIRLQYVHCFIRIKQSIEAFQSESKADRVRADAQYLSLASLTATRTNFPTASDAIALLTVKNLRLTGVLTGGYSKYRLSEFTRAAKKWFFRSGDWNRHCFRWVLVSSAQSSTFTSQRFRSQANHA
jgi:hypothetical protein